MSEVVIPPDLQAQYDHAVGGIEYASAGFRQVITLIERIARLETAAHYLSTACYHENHDKCRLKCKFCQSECRCECHVQRASS